MAALYGARIHRIRNLNEFTPQQARDAAAAGWLMDNQYYAIMANPHRYPDFHVQGDLHVDPQLILAGNAECIFLAEFTANDNVEYTIIKNPEDVMIRGTAYMTLRRSYTSTFERREYCPRAAGQKIVHYRANDNGYRRDMALATEAGRHLMDDSQTAAADRNELADEVWNHI